MCVPAATAWPHPLPDSISLAPPAAETVAHDHSTAPDFTLTDHLGGTFSLYHELSRRASAATPLVIVFFRGHWCPYCRRYLSKLRDHYPRIEATGATLVAISPETPATSAALARELALPFLLLSDTGGTTIDAYGVRNRLTNDGPASRGKSVLPHPAVFILSPDNRILFRSVDRNYKKRTTVRTILRELGHPPYETDRPETD